MIVVIYYSRFGFLTPEDGTARLSRNDCNKFPIISCVTTEKSAVIIGIFVVNQKRGKVFSLFSVQIRDSPLEKASGN
jgi:hypothetical protein